MKKKIVVTGPVALLYHELRCELHDVVEGGMLVNAFGASHRAGIFTPACADFYHDQPVLVAIALLDQVVLCNEAHEMRNLLILAETPTFSQLRNLIKPTDVGEKVFDVLSGGEVLARAMLLLALCRLEEWGEIVVDLRLDERLSGEIIQDTILKNLTDDESAVNNMAAAGSDLADHHDGGGR